MKRFFILLAIAGLFASCNGDSENNEQNNDSSLAETIINEATKQLVVSLADFEAKAPELVGKTIQISGIVDHVCKHGGNTCGLTLNS